MLYVAGESAITLDSVALIDDVADIDSLGSFDFMGDIVGSGEYYFDNALDMGAVWPFKVRIDIDLEAYDVGNFIDQRVDLIDDWASFDSEVINALDAQIYMRTTDDDPGGSPTWSDWKKIVNASYVARAAQFKLVCVNDEPDHNLYVKSLGVVVDMDDRTWNSGKLTSSAGGDVTVTYDYPFYAKPSIGVTMENANSGDYYVINPTTFDEEKFEISFYNSSNAQLS